MRRRGLMSGGKIKDYLKFTARSSGTFTFSIPASVSPSDLPYIAYSINGSTWTTTNNVANQAVTITTPTIEKDQYVLIKSEAKRTAVADSDGDSTRISSTCDFDVSGNILSLLLGDKFNEKTTIDYYDSNEHDYMFDRLFELARIVHADELKIPIVGVPKYCFRDTFKECTTMILGPKKIPIIKVAESGLRGMFGYCYSLIKMPDLTSISGSGARIQNRSFFYTFERCYMLEQFTPIQILKSNNNDFSYAFQGMFKYCSKLKSAPILEFGGKVNNYTFTEMFANCTNLETGPIFSCDNFMTAGYNSTFDGCSKLNYIKVLGTIYSPGTQNSRWFTRGVAATGIFVKHIDATWDVWGENGIPNGWTVLYYNPSTNKYYLSDKTTECDDHGNVINA